MKDKEFLRLFELDCRYYDSEQREAEGIIRLSSPKGKTILDVGAGIGRLSFPLAKYAKKIVALDIDSRLKKFYEKHKPRNLVFIGESLESYSRKTKNKFDIILVVWAGFNPKFIKYLRKISHKNTLIITITGDKRSENHKLINQLFTNNYSVDNKKSKSVKLSELKLIRESRQVVNVTYPSEEEALNAIDADLRLWSNKKLEDSDKIKIMKSILKHKIKSQIKFKEIAVMKVFRFK